MVWILLSLVYIFFTARDLPDVQDSQLVSSCKPAVPRTKWHWYKIGTVRCTTPHSFFISMTCSKHSYLLCTVGCIETKLSQCSEGIHFNKLQQLFTVLYVRPGSKLSRTSRYDCKWELSKVSLNYWVSPGMGEPYRSPGKLWVRKQ